MDPHPLFADRAIPARARLGPFLMRGLGPEDLDEDLAALRETEGALQGLFGDPADPWPAGITRDANLLDLCWHRREFLARRSFAWVSADPATDAYLGCAYVYPGFFAGAPLKAGWWFRASAMPGRYETRAAGFGRRFLDWLAGPDWPEAEVVALGLPALAPS
ncbi:MAG: hypothetical protein VX463_06385 [Pseudomonadota bacterium]|nr:hypothetical protein [Pseudomonadota bacterium]